MPTVDKWYSTIGRATHDVAQLELLLMNCLRVSCGFTFKQAQAIYYSPDALQTRIKLLRNLLKATGADMQIRQIINDIVVVTERANRRRNELAHSMATAKSDLPGGGHSPFARVDDRLNLKHMDQPKVPLTDGYLESSVTMIRDSLMEARGKYQSLCRLLGVPLELWQ